MAGVPISGVSLDPPRSRPVHPVPVLLIPDQRYLTFLIKHSPLLSVLATSPLLWLVRCASKRVKPRTRKCFFIHKHPVLVDYVVSNYGLPPLQTWDKTDFSHIIYNENND